MLEAALTGIFAVFFFVLGIRHNKKIHKEDGSGTGLTDSIILSLIVEGLFWVFDKVSFWVIKIIYFIIAIALMIFSYLLFVNG